MLLDWLISFSMAFSGQIVITFAAVRMLAIKRPGIIWAIALVTCMGTACVNSFDVPADVQALWSAANLAVSIVTYVVFSSLKPLRALFIVACIMLVTLLAEFAVVLVTLYGFGANVTSGPAYAYEHPEAYIFLIVFHSLVLGLLLYAAYVLTRRIATGKSGSSTLRSLLFPVSQSLLLLVAIVVVRVLAVDNEAALLYGSLLTLAVLAAYLVFYLAVRRQREQELADARIAMLQEEGARAYEQAQSIAQESQRVAKLRHDFRNQVQVIELLCEQGETSQATELLDGLLLRVRQEGERC